MKYPWKNGLSSILILYSIFAATSGIFLTYSLTCDPFLIIDIPLLLSILLFIYSGEKASDADDENDTKKFLYSYIPYNIATIFLIFGLVFGVYHKFYPNGFNVNNDENILCFCMSHNLLIFIGIFILFSYKWVKDLWFLFFKNDNDFNIYIEELEGKATPVEDHNMLMKLFYKFRNLIHKK